METIRRNLALAEYDIKETPQGKQQSFSIRFVTKSGEVVYLPNAVACGLTMNFKENRVRGVIAIDSQGNRIGHPYPVSIDLLLEWNGKKIIL